MSEEKIPTLQDVLAARLAGKKVALVLSGGNLAPDQLQMILAKERP